MSDKVRTVYLEVPLTINGQEVKTVDLDFMKLTGADLARAETEARTLGEMSPIIHFSQKYHAAIAAKLIGCVPDDVMAMNAKDYVKVTTAVATFLTVSD